MTLTKALSDNYQEFTRSTIVYNNKDALNYLVLGLISEMSEFVEGDEESEAGDVCWYIFRIFDTFGKNFYEAYYKGVKKDTGTALTSLGKIASLHKKYIRGDRIPDYQIRMMDMVLQEFYYLESYFGKSKIPSILLKNKDKLIERSNRNAIKGSGETVEERV